MKLLDIFAYINEIIKIIFLVAYFVYYYKLNKLLTIVRHMPNTDTEQNQLFLKIAIMMGVQLWASPKWLTPSLGTLELERCCI